MLNRLYRCGTGLLLALGSGGPVAAQDTTHVAIQEYARKHGFSGAIPVARRDTTIFHEAFGTANRELTVPIRTDSKFKVASITKPSRRSEVYQLPHTTDRLLAPTII